MKMKALVQEKERAIVLRKSGRSYTDILKELSVAKSTLSMWLKDLPLTKQEKRSLKSRRDSNISRGRIKAATALHLRRLGRDRELFQISKREFEQRVDDPFFHTGIALYWAEGSKRNSRFGFTNSDPQMMRVMVNWIKTYFAIPPEYMHARLYLHKPYAHERCEEYWSKITGIPLERFARTIYKPTGLLVKKRPNYMGCLRIELSRTTHLRKMLFWQELLFGIYGKKG